MELQSVKQRFGIIGRSQALDNALSTAVRVANTDLTVMITGESGTGKEVFSKVIHALSARKHNQFIAVNCGAIPEGTINSELFGHEKGSFTGATGDRKGYFESVDTGTIFLDEIGEMPLDTQAYLLRILESGEFLRVGSSKVLKTNVRVIAATNVSLENRVKEKKFREDLFYRLNTVPIKVPPLRERPEDIWLLFRKFCIDFAERYHATPIQVNDDARATLENYSWPGNIRELKNVSEQLSVLSDKPILSTEDIIKIVPNLKQRNLPALSKNEHDGGSFQEREILYKLLFDMKADLTDLKNLVFGLIHNNDLQVPDGNDIQPVPKVFLSNNQQKNYVNQAGEYLRKNDEDEMDYHSNDQGRPVILDNNTVQNYNKAEIVDENLSLEDMEKEMIKKALKKYGGRRREAADELGISERTLYRKINYYDINY